MTSAVPFRNFDPERNFASFQSPNNGIEWSSNLCNNGTLAQSLVANIQAFITTLETNGSFTGVLQQHNQAIAYIQNSANTNILSSNCTAYFNGLTNALKLDKIAEEQEENYEESVYRQLRQILQSVIGSPISMYRDLK